MKKLLGIVVLGLLLSGCSGGEAHRLNVQSHKYTAKVVETTDCALCVLMTFGVQAIPIAYYGYSNNSYEDAVRNAIRACKPASYKKCTEDKSYSTVKNTYASTSTSSSSSNYATVEEHKDLILTAKSRCKDMGFKEETESMANCVKDIYMKKTSSTKIVQGSTVTTPKKRIDPSVWDDLLNVSKGLGSGKSISESLGGTTGTSSSSTTSMPKGTCYYTGEETVGHNKSCRYSCTGSIDTITIAAMEICPLHIQR